MIAGIGTDLVRIGRFRRFVAEKKEGLLERLFTAGEREYAEVKHDPAPHLAARFAAKEAFVKALGLGLRDGIGWQDMEVVNDALGCPSLRITGRALEIFRQRGLEAAHLSYSHDGDYAVATVVLEKA
ncbi:MAG: holo-[acyl-carrier-protein] synthase [Desulfuromonadales bacterium]|jgi:holo-[acyl-carrier protein] synthase